MQSEASHQIEETKPRPIGRLSLRRWLPREEWRRNQYLLTLAIFITFFGFTFVNPFLALYLVELGVTDLRAAAAWSGAIYAASPMISGFVAPFWGAIADRYGRRLVLTRLLFAFSIIMALTGLAQSAAQLLALRGLMGLFGGFNAVAMALVTSQVPTQEVGQAVGLMQTAQLLDKAVGPMFGGVVADLAGIRNSFFLTATLCIVASIVITRAYHGDDRPAGRSGQPGFRIPWRQALQQPNFRAAMVILFLVQIVDRTYPPLPPLYLQLLDAPPGRIATIAGAILAIGALTASFSAIFFGRLTTRYPVRNLLLVVLAGGVLLNFPFGLATSWWQLLFIKAGLGLFVGSALTLVYTIGGTALPAAQRGTAFGLLAMGANIGVGTGPLAMGFVAARNMRSVFFLGSLIYAFTFLFTLFSVKPVKGWEEGPSEEAEVAPV
ncbi:MAG: MFS transporter [Chloroflexi bacterium]|nr:MFS transporter [Chloroflexota bacterium]